MLDQSHGSLSQLVEDLEFLRTNAAIFERLTDYLLRLQLGIESPTALLVPVESGPLTQVLLPVDQGDLFLLAPEHRVVRDIRRSSGCRRTTLLKIANQLQVLLNLILETLSKCLLIMGLVIIKEGRLVDHVMRLMVVIRRTPLASVIQVHLHHVR